MSSAFDTLSKAAPRLPELTCPKIDAALDEINYAKDLCDQIPMDLAITAFNILADLADDAGPMETIRAANDGLRRNGTYWFRECRKAHAEIEMLRAEVARLRGENTDIPWTHVVR